MIQGEILWNKSYGGDEKGYSIDELSNSGGIHTTLIIKMVCGY